MPITGTWYNELGSILTISSSSGNALSGTYNTASGSASGNYQLVGRLDSGSGTAASATGWTVAWSNSAFGSSHSATSWTGLYQPPGNGTEEIYTLWLLATEMPEAAQWGAVRVGQDTFTRTQPTAEAVAKKMARGEVSHPASAAPKK